MTIRDGDQGKIDADIVHIEENLETLRGDHVGRHDGMAIRVE